jgi:hypothetical protein
VHPDVRAPLAQPVQRLVVAERDGRLQPGAAPYAGQVEDEVDQAGPGARRDVAGLGPELDPDRPVGLRRGDDVSGGGPAVAVLDHNMKSVVTFSHDASRSSILLITFGLESTD